jgi:hypothetical protein
MPEVCQNGEQCLELWSQWVNFFMRQYTRQYQNLQEQKTVFNNQLHALEHAMFKSKKDDKTTTGYN